MTKTDLAREPWQILRDTCTPATFYYDQAGWQERLDTILSALTAPTNDEVREMVEAARENPDARAYTNAEIAALLERLSPPPAIRKDAPDE